MEYGKVMDKILYLGPHSQLVDFLEKEHEVVRKEEKITKEDVNEIKPKYVISYGYRHIIKQEVLDTCEIINLHISYLPWNRGADPNFWSFYDETPKGVTIHFIDKGIDTGDIIFQKEVDFEEQHNTLGTTYEKLKQEIENLFMEKWEDFTNQRFNRNPQSSEEGSLNYKKKLQKIWHHFPNQWQTTLGEIKCVKEQILK